MSGLQQCNNYLKCFTLEHLKALGQNASPKEEPGKILTALAIISGFITIGILPAAFWTIRSCFYRKPSEQTPIEKRIGTSTRDILPPPPQQIATSIPQVVRSTEQMAKMASSGQQVSDASAQQILGGNQINAMTLSALKRLIFQGQILPWGMGKVKMIGEEHIAAILYTILIASEKRSDCAITLKPFGNALLPENFDNTAMPRYVIIPMSVNNNMHNTILIVDHVKKEYAYFDSLIDSHIPDRALAECRAKGVIKKDYQEFNTTSIRTHQNDDWSCGFHSIENALSYVSNLPSSEKHPDGMQLLTKYDPVFTTFVSTHGADGDIFNDARLCRRQKLRLREALEELNAKDGTHPLNPLWLALQEELRSQQESIPKRPITDFIDMYQSSDDLLGAQILTIVRDRQSPIYANMPKDINETREDAAKQVEGIATCIRAFLQTNQTAETL